MKKDASDRKKHASDRKKVCGRGKKKHASDWKKDATDWKKSYGYVGADDSYYLKHGSEGRVSGRNVFLLLSDVIMGEPYQATDTGSWLTPPNKCDSIAMFPHNIDTLGNDEYTIFDTDYQRIRYIIEFERA